MFKLYQRGTPAAAGRMRPRYSIHLLGLLFLGMLLCCEFALTIPLLHTPVAAFDHTASTLDESCNQAFYSPDGNPLAKPLGGVRRPLCESQPGWHFSV